MRGPRQREADLRAQLAANRLAARRLTELAERHGETLLADAMDEVLDYAERRTRSAIATIPDGTYRAADVLEDDAGDEPRDLPVRCSVTVAGRFDRDRLHRDGIADRRQPQLPAVGHEVRRVLRRAGADGPRHPALRRRLPPGDGHRSGGLAGERARTGRGGGRQRRDLEPDRRRRDARAGRGRGRAGPRAGHDEQRHSRQRGLHLLRDHRRRAGRHAPTHPGRRPCTWR